MVKTLWFIFRAIMGMEPGVYVDMNGFPLVIRMYFDTTHPRWAHANFCRILKESE